MAERETVQIRRFENDEPMPSSKYMSPILKLSRGEHLLTKKDKHRAFDISLFVTIIRASQLETYSLRRVSHATLGLPTIASEL